jgi:glutamyl-tRNA synthetase
MLSFLFVDDAGFRIDPDLRAALLDDQGLAAVRAALHALEPLKSWDTASIEAALRAALVDGLGLKPRDAFGQVRVAVTGKKVSPPLFESMELLGRERSMHRLSGILG